MFKNPEKAVRVNHDSTISISTQIYTLNPFQNTFQFNLGLSELRFLEASDSDMGTNHWTFGFEHTPISKFTLMLVTDVGDLMCW